MSAVQPIEATTIERRRYAWLFLPTLVLGFVWLASGYFVPGNLAGLTARLQGLVTTFLGIFIEALPFLMAGVIASIIIHEFVTPAHLARFIPRNSVAAAFVGSMLGMAFPVCECGAIPTARRLLRKGSPAPLGIAFALAAPVVNPIVIISTMVAFNDWRWAAGRVGLTMIIAVLIALILGVGIKRESVLAPESLLSDDDKDACCDHTHGEAHDHDHHHGPATGIARWRAMLSHGSLEFFEMLQYLIIGALLAATMQTFIPQTVLLQLAGGSGLLGLVLSIIVLMGVAVLLSVCSTVDAFLGLAFLGVFHPGAVMAFLVFGPMIDIKSTLMLTSTFRRPAVASMVVLAVNFSIVAGLVTLIVAK